jgi:hypothetical protein
VKYQPRGDLRVDAHTYDAEVFDKRMGGDYWCVRVSAGRPKRKRIVPPAGERYAHIRETYPRNVEVYVSPTGRSVRVYVDGAEIK